MTKLYKSTPSVVVDLRNSFSVVRDQGARPLCLAFSASDLNSLANTTLELLSVEFLAHYAYLFNNQTDYNQGLTVSSIIETLRVQGQPLEHLLPYNVMASEPEKPVNTYPELFFSQGKEFVSSVECIKNSLSVGSPLIICINLSYSFFAPLEPYIIDHDCDENLGGHAVIALGYGYAPCGKTCILIRNSWGGYVGRWRTFLVNH